MKKITVTPLLLLLPFFAFCQATDMSIQNDFKEMSSYGRIQTGYEGIQTYSSGNVKGSQFFNEGWCTGSVTTVSNETISNYLFMYDKMNQQLYIKQKDANADSTSYQLTRGTQSFIRPEKTDVIVIAQKEQIVSFTINTDKPHVFIQAATFDSSLKGNFLEVLIQSNNYSLFKLTKTAFEKFDSHDMIKMKNGDFADEFVDHIDYFIYHNNRLEKVKLNENSIRKVLKDQRDKLDNFFDQHANDEVDEQLLVSLINDLNL